MFTELPHVPARMRLNESEPPPRIPPFPPPEQFGPPYAQTSIEASDGIWDSELLIRPPSATSEKLTPVAFGSMPKPKDVSRSLAGDDWLFRVTPTVSELELKPLTVSVPLPDNVPAPLLM